MLIASLPTILIVDDSRTTRAVIKRVIGMLDHPIAEIYEAADGAAAIKRLERARVDVVLADLNMPVMDGFELISRMREIESWRRIPVVVISAQPDSRQIEMLKRNGVTAYLPKPFTAEGVRDVIGPLLEAARQETAAAHQQLHHEFNLTLAEALAQALATTAFISPELVCGPDHPPLEAGARVVRVNFKGHDAAGSLSLAASAEFAAMMVANLDAQDATAGDDALMELANVTCGLLLRMRPGGGAGFHLEPPQMWSAQQTRPADILNGSDLIMLSADGQLIAAQVIADPALYGA